MKIAIRGWSRDMGTKVIADYNLTELGISSDRHRRVSRRDGPRMFSSLGRTFIAWFQPLRNMGDYRMEIEFSNDDVLRLFKSRFGSELNPWLVDDEGFTISPELTKRVLRTVKLSDVTLGDLAAMNGAATEEPATAEKLVETANITPFRRRV